MFKRKNKGFTLIELLVVIAIIGVLASVVLASLNSARKKSRDARRVADIEQIQLALEMYFDANSEYPDALSSLVGAGIPVVPDDPLPGAAPNDYRYDNLTGAGGACVVATGDCTSYHLSANLEESTPAALSSDLDTAPSGSTIDSPDADGCTNETGRYCYDVQP
ncbi:MAG: type II secretion system GspH family protein [Candidatus Marinimicrobia bacterium]|nr:type II secretion system GspH family protein [Candidatus Neomarinimicrobiota bacterium]